MPGGVTSNGLFDSGQRCDDTHTGFLVSLGLYCARVAHAVQRREKVMSNRLCSEIGHSWQPTTADTFRRCNRQECKAVQRFYNGAWVDVARIMKRKEPTQAETPHDVSVA